MKGNTRYLVLSAAFVALGILLPQVLHPLGIAGQVFSPMHIPVLLCGFVCGRRYGAICGLLTPLLSSWFFGMPVIFPVAVAMAFELVAYGYASGLAVKFVHHIFALVLAMLIGRGVLGLVNFILFSITGAPYTFNAFIMAAFVTCWPALLIQIIVIPLVLFALQKAKVVSFPAFKIKKNSFKL